MSKEQPNNPLHGLTLKAIVEDLQRRHGWEGLARRIPVNCFKNEPSVRSSLKFLRRTPWAREKVEALYLQDHRAENARIRRDAANADRTTPDDV